MPQSRRQAGRLSKTGVLLALILLLIAIIAFLWPEDCLVAECGGKRLFTWPIRAGECFDVTFIHSLNLSPITDVIEWTGESFIVRKSIFVSFGAGVPVPSDGVGTELVFVDGRYELRGIDQYMQDFTIMTQEVPNHRITLNGREAFLLDLAGSGKAVDIKVRRTTLLSRLALNIGL